MNDKEILLKKNLKIFFTKQRLILMKRIIDDKKPISIRKLEWFISVYCKKYNIQYRTSSKLFNVYNSYKNEQLKSYSKKYFDFFRRKNTFLIKIDEKNTLETTIAQMNFFKWVIENDILEYIMKNINKINEAMESSKNGKDKVKVGTIYIDRNDELIVTFD